MKILVWLWNPGKKYEKNRHNIGFLFLDFFWEKKWFLGFKTEKKFSWEISQWNINWEKIILLKPQTFMNLSWKSIKSILNFYKLKNEDLILIYDDKDLDFWKIRFREKGSAWGHNWIKDTILQLWTDIFKRIKIWVKNEKLNFMDTADFVLSNFSEGNLIQLNTEIFKEIELKIEEIV